MSPTRYLSTLAYSPDWLDRLQVAVPDVLVEQITAEQAGDVPDEVWRTVEVLHTSSVFPDPSRCPALRWVQLDTSGVDHVRSQPLWQSDVPIATIGGISPVPLAEYVVFALLGAAHRLPAMLEVRASRAWPDLGERWRRFLPAPVAGSTVTIVGFGRIGREIGRLAEAFGMSVIGVTRTGRPPDGTPELANFAPCAAQPSSAEVVTPDRLHDALGRADYAVVIVPLTDETANLVDVAAIAALKPGAVLINVARGGIVDEQALLAALRSGAVSAVVLDVFDDEPLPPDSPWWDEPGAFVTPHVAGLAPLYEEQVLQLLTSNLERHRRGEALLNLVDRGRGY